MEKYYALINSSKIVEQVVVGDDTFADSIRSQYSLVLDITDRNDRPSQGDSYYQDGDRFISNSQTEIYLPTIQNVNTISTLLMLPHDFVPFSLSEYKVSYDPDEDMILIGCKKYSYQGFLSALYEVMAEDETTVECFTSEEEGPIHGKFGITWDDAQLLYNKLIRDRL